MTSRPNRRKAEIAAGLIITSGAAWGCLPGSASASPADLYYQRSVMAAADLRCRLFDPGIRQALAAGQAQARGAALRSQIAASSLDATRSRAEAKAAAVACDDPDIALAAGRVREGFAGFARLQRITYPGDLTVWSAKRNPADGWRLLQTTAFGFDRLNFGIGAAGALTAEGRFADGAAPFTARLLIRDSDRTPGPYLDRRAADAKGVLPLQARTPPRYAARIFTASYRTPSDGAPGAWAFRFPAAAAEAMAKLDPREAVAVEFALPGSRGETVRRAYVEVGDFAAAKAFLQVAAR